MGIKQLNQDISDGARWARLVALLIGLGACVAVAIALCIPWDVYACLAVVFGTVAILSAANYLRVTRR